MAAQTFSNTSITPTLSELPGGHVVAKGLDDLRQGTRSREALLVAIAAPRLRGLGFDISSDYKNPEHQLYFLLEDADADTAHSRYNALIRRIVSFARAYECATS